MTACPAEESPVIFEGNARRWGIATGITLVIMLALIAPGIAFGW
jgi:hypothetical protein